jgi:exopolysaccharide production protein ExoQ
LEHTREDAPDRPAGRRRRLAKAADGILALDQDRIVVAYSFLVALILLLNAQLSAISTLLLLMIAVAAPVVFWRDMTANVDLRIAVIPILLAFASAFWSHHPGVTIYYSVQLLLTFFIAASLSSFHKIHRSLEGLFYAYLVFAILSIVFGKYALWEDGQYVFVGLLISKNNYGAMNFVVCMLGLYWAHRNFLKRRYAQFLVGAFAIALGLFGCLLSKATGALINTFFGLFLYGVLALWMRLPLQSRLFSLFLFVGFAIVGGAVLAMSWQDLSNAVLKYFNKSSDLTGRADLWFVADRLIDQHYWLGIGQFGFWVQGDPAPEALWSQFLIASRRGFNFHNSYREIMVHLGMVGIIVYGAVFASLIFRRIYGLVAYPRGYNIYYFAVLLSLVSRIPVESALPLVPVNSDTVFLLVALTVRYPRPGKPERRPPKEPPPERIGEI